MKRNMELIRAILFHVEQACNAGDSLEISESAVGTVPFDFDGLTFPILHEHIRLAADAGLVESTAHAGYMDVVFIDRLTWAGHEFLDAIRDDGVWKKIVAATMTHGGAMGMGIIKGLAAKYLSEKLGIPMPV